ncbi:MAG: arsenate reductase family protein [Candidatus Fimadaptatus sp.]|jgi:arsenate reductase
MNIQIYALKKNFDVQKAERYFKERRIKYQLVDLAKHPLGAREMDAICRAVGVDELIDKDSKLYPGSMLRYTSGADRQKAVLLDDLRLMRTPIVRNGTKATVGYHPEIWDTWE